MTRRRQANGRPNRINVSLTDDQYKTWQGVADQNGVTIQRWMVDELEGKPPTMVTRALITELGGIRLGAAGAFANLNQLARRAHLEGVDLVGWLTTTVALERLINTIEQWVADHQ